MSNKLTKKGHFEYYMGDLTYNYSRVAKCIIENLSDNVADAVSFADYVRQEKDRATEEFLNIKKYQNALNVKISLREQKITHYDYPDEIGYFIVFNFELPMTEKELTRSSKRKETVKKRTAEKKKKEQEEELKLLEKLKKKYSKT